MNVPDLSGGNVSGVSGVRPPCASDLIALAETLRGMSGETDTRPWPGERRSYPDHSHKEGKRMAAAIIEADFGTVMVSPYTQARITLVSKGSRLRVQIANERRPDAPDDAREFRQEPSVCLRIDRLQHLIDRLNAAKDTATRLKRKPIREAQGAGCIALEPRPDTGAERKNARPRLET